jgi:hypothetical protein
MMINHEITQTSQSVERDSFGLPWSNVIIRNVCVFASRSYRDLQIEQAAPKDPFTLTSIYPATTKHAIINAARSAMLPSHPQMQLSHPHIHEGKRKTRESHAMEKTSPEAATHFLPPELSASVSCHIHDA